MTDTSDQPGTDLIKIVYFDEQSASDYLDISAGGKEVTSAEHIRNRTNETHAKVDAAVSAKFSWLPFIGASASAGAGAEASREAQSILSKTLSNTILTDYLEQVDQDPRIERLRDLSVSAASDTMAFVKMYTPYMIAAKDDDPTVELARLDEALTNAKGYYELIAQHPGEERKSVLRFNLRAFRNNYGLTDLIRMRLTYHGIFVGQTLESSLTLSSELSAALPQASLSAVDLVDGVTSATGVLLDVYDVVLAGSNMAADIEITLYFGPVKWFHQKTAHLTTESLLDIVMARDDSTRVLTVVQGDQSQSAPGTAPDRPENVVAESSDYASLNEHVISNFAGLVRPIQPKHLHLHNPPAQIQAQLSRIFPVLTERYVYPTVTASTLASISKDFAERLVGQAHVRAELLAALYPLTAKERSTPIVLMLYGPSGVGKTETAHFVNGLLGGELMRKQFSMFHSEKFASYVFGGAHTEASFAHDLLDRESGVILIDEFDKANPAFHNAFYQLFDGGVFEDKNYKVEVGPAVIICTSNYDSEAAINTALGEALASRFDAMIRFEHLSGEHLRIILERLVASHFATLTDDEQRQIDLNEVSQYLEPVTRATGNIRRLGKTVEQVFSILLVRKLLMDVLDSESGHENAPDLAAVSDKPANDKSREQREESE
ncbi:DUF6414 family protein [Frondihabitans sp. PAMC 28766]|uniref:DUF6414 family protein n=1 Tax=Frondihabitans sp. PAMC 28766 TaxID=1795630 RepID=UPI000A8A05FE|nr:DUF6414 family protein [Frondihabitans sp. PAMC 28766]